jgi:hypothetical protein
MTMRLLPGALMVIGDSRARRVANFTTLEINDGQAHDHDAPTARSAHPAFRSLCLRCRFTC